MKINIIIAAALSVFISSSYAFDQAADISHEHHQEQKEVLLQVGP